MNLSTILLDDFILCFQKLVSMTFYLTSEIYFYSNYLKCIGFYLVNFFFKEITFYNFFKVIISPVASRVQI